MTSEVAQGKGSVGVVRRTLRCAGLAGVVLAANGAPAGAHDPVFGLGPHTLYKGGIEIEVGGHRASAEHADENEFSASLKYGITGDWTVGISVPYLDISEPGSDVSGPGDVELSTKYRFWRDDRLGVQEAAAVSLAAVMDTTSDNNRLGHGATDIVFGLSYGYEGRKWYRWAAARYRYNGEDNAGLKRGNRLLLDLVLGIRPTPTGYLEPDWVWMVELNAEIAERAERAGVLLPNSGGTEVFVSPGLMWTYRNFAIKTGVQLPLVSDLNGTQDGSKYRAKLEFEWHL